MKKLLLFIFLAMGLAVFPIYAYAATYYHDIEKDLRSTFVQINKSDANVTLTTKDCSSTLITNYGWNATASDQTFTLATTEEGLMFELRNLVTDATADLYLDPSDNVTQIILNGTACGDGERVWFENVTAHEAIKCETISLDGGATYDWACDSVNGIQYDKGS